MFAKTDLVQMKNECVSELEALGYEMLPIEDIDFSSKLRASYAIAKPGVACRRDKETHLIVNPGVIINVDITISYLDNTWKKEVKTLVMHECIHAIKHENFPHQLMTAHGKQYDKIKDHVENIYGYIGIDDATGHYFETVLPKIRKQIKSRKQ